MLIYTSFLLLHSTWIVNAKKYAWRLTFYLKKTARVHTKRSSCRIPRNFKNCNASSWILRPGFLEWSCPWRLSLLACLYLVGDGITMIQDNLDRMLNKSSLMSADTLYTQRSNDTNNTHSVPLKIFLSFQNSWRSRLSTQVQQGQVCCNRWLWVRISHWQTSGLSKATIHSALEYLGFSALRYLLSFLATSWLLGFQLQQ